MVFDAAYHRNWRHKHKARLAQKHRTRFKKDKKYRQRIRAASLRSYYKTKSKTKKYNSSHTAYVKVYRARLKRKIIEEYGQRCVCCGETMYEFLTPDHIKGGGNEHIRRRSTVGVYRDIIKEGFPRDKYRILCMNCNWGRSVYGKCPHELANK